MQDDQLFFLGNKALLRNTAGEVLLLHVTKKEGRTYWDLPGGRVNKGEDPEMAVVREVEEETGMRGVRVVRHLAMARHQAMIPISDKEEAGLILSVYLCETPDSDVQSTEEGVLFEWCAPSEVLDRIRQYPEALKAAIGSALAA